MELNNCFTITLAKVLKYYGKPAGTIWTTIIYYYIIFPLAPSIYNNTIK